MATIRQRRPGVWEVRGYTGKDVDGKTTQVSRTVYGTKKDAELAAAELTVKPARNAGGRKLRQLLEEWVEIKTPGWADLTVRDQVSRVRLVCADPIANMSVASIGVSDIDRWVARLRRAGVGEGRSATSTPSCARRCSRRSVGNGSPPTRPRTLRSSIRSGSSSER